MLGAPGWRWWSRWSLDTLASPLPSSTCPARHAWISEHPHAGAHAGAPSSGPHPPSSCATGFPARKATRSRCALGKQIHDRVSYLGNADDRCVRCAGRVSSHLFEGGLIPKVPDHRRLGRRAARLRRAPVVLIPCWSAVHAAGDPCHVRAGLANYPNLNALEVRLRGNLELFLWFVFLASFAVSFQMLAGPAPGFPTRTLKC